MSPLPPDEWQFGTARIGRRVRAFAELDSTNSFAAAFGQEGDAVVALHQTAGRGRFDRTWQSRPGSSLLLSAVLSPPADLRRPAVLTAWAAVGVSHAVESLAAVRPVIKWPNDLLIDGRKVCGILIEQRSATVVGIGLNLTQTADEFAAAELPHATSLLVESGRAIEVKAAAGVVLTHLDANYGVLLGGGRAWFESEWADRFGLVGEVVRVELTDGSTLTGRLRGMTFDGLSVEVGGSVRVVVPETAAHVRAV